MELGLVCVDGVMEEARFGCGGGGGSVPQASQERKLNGFTSVQMSQVQVSFRGGGGFEGAGIKGGGFGLVAAGMGGRCP